MVLCNITQGWTKQLGPFTLKLNGAALDLTGMTVTLLIRPSTSKTNYSDTTGDVSVAADQTTNRGQVFFKPDATDFAASKSPYHVHWKVTDVAGDVVFIPNGEPDSIVVSVP